MDSGNFGPVAITKSIRIIAEGVEAVINTAGDSTGVHIQGTNNTIVTLRGITFDMRGSSSNSGISFVAGAALHVQNCIFRRASSGIDFVPSSGVRHLFVSDSVFEHIIGTAILVAPSVDSGVIATLDRVRVNGPGNGGVTFQATSTTGAVQAVVRDSVFTGLGPATGIFSQTAGVGTSDVMVERSTSAGNTEGVHSSGANSIIRVTDSTVTANASGLVVTSGGVIVSYSNNRVNGNAGNESFSASVPLQ